MELSSDTSKLAPIEDAVVSRFVSSINAGELAAAVVLFAEDAQVNDQLRNFWGREAIAGWLEREIIGEHVQLHLCAFRKHYDAVVARAEMCGDFSVAGGQQPLAVDLHFTVQAQKVVRLLVLLARDDSAEPEVRRLL